MTNILAPIEFADWDDSIREPLRVFELPSGDTLDMFKVYAHFPAGLLAMATSGAASLLSFGDREVVTVRTLAQVKGEYELYFHSRAFLSHSGTQEELDSLLDVSKPAVFADSPLRTLLSAAVDEVIAEGRISPATVDGLAEWCTGGHIVQILVTINLYRTASLIVRTAQLPLDANAEEVADALLGASSPVVDEYEKGRS